MLVCQCNMITSKEIEDNVLDLLKADPEVSERLSEDELNALFDLGYHFKHVDAVFDRLFGPRG